MPSRLPKKELTLLSKMSLDELYEHVGFSVYASVRLRQTPYAHRPRPAEPELDFYLGRKYGDPIHLPSREEARRFGKTIFRRLKSALQEKICQEWDYCKRRGRYHNEVALANAIVGFVAQTGNIPMSAAYGLGFILTKIGLDKFCRCSSP